MITRIRELLDARQLSPTHFADLIGVGRPVISHILSERNKPSLEVVQKIIGAFPDISLPWLLAGTGPMLAAATSPPPRAQEATAAPVLAAPAVAVAASAPITTQPASYVRPAIATQPSPYPQPPKFRPGPAASVAPTTDEAIPASRHRADDSFLAASARPEASFATPAAPAASSAVAAAVPGPGPSAPVTAAAPATATAAVADPGQAPTLPPVATATAIPPVANGTLGDFAAATAATATPATSLEAPTAAVHPAAALSFLGEPGKAIRRIVIFYRDGSFSDFLPEAN